MDNLEKSNIDPEVKKKINEEGYDENVAVLIGKEEEMPNLKAKLENEGRTVDVETYIRMHKEILVPKDGMEQFSGFKYNIGDAKLIIKQVDVLVELYFCDKDKNLAFVSIDASKIANLKDISGNLTDLKFKTKINEDLIDLGFDFNSVGVFNDFGKLRSIIQEQERMTQNKNKQEKKEKFDF